MLSTIFVLLVGLTVALIVFTPLKYYIPGATTDYKSATELRQLKYQVDGLEKQNTYNIRYIEGIKKALSGSNSLQLDTIKLVVPKVDSSND